MLFTAFKNVGIASLDRCNTHSTRVVAFLIEDFKQEGTVEEVWGRPPEGWVKINCDGAFDVKYGKASVGVICRDGRGMVLDGAAEKKTADEVEVVEAMVVTKGVELSDKNRWENVLMQTNSFIGFSETKKKDSERWKLKPILKRIKRVAKHSKVEMCLEGWIHHSPSSLVFILDNDGLPALPVA
ncbi:hypothetical protein GOBAR_DD26445 [Gossypium barbadense]|nr:hypothetical protein GOBAR_DD26445 [Gossypium barbadense]